LYPLLFQDDLYAIAYNCSSNKLDLRKIKNLKLNENFNFFILRRLIHIIHWRKYFFPFSKNYKKKSMLIIKKKFIWKQFEKALLWFLKLFIPYNWSLLWGKEEEWMNGVAINLFILYFLL
jgi:hypothetical protein